MKKFDIAYLMAKPGGRLLRVALGLVIVIIGLSLSTGAARDIVVLVGLIPILAGVLNVCGLAPLVGKPFSGKKCLR
jgi:predicted RND superfamily exporter protein